MEKHTSMQKYRYAGTAGLAAYLNQIAGLIAAVLAVVGAVGLPIIAVTQEGLGSARDMGTLACLSIWILLVLGSVGLTLMNSYPIVWIGEDHLEISAFVFMRVRIAWTDVVDVGAGRVPWGFVLVRARKITPFHRLYGWLYSRSLLPSFLIGPKIENQNYLLEEIRTRATNRRVV